MTEQSNYNNLTDVNSDIVYNQLSEYTRIAKYAQYNKKRGRRETWDEQTDRVFNMHKVKYKKFLDNEKFMSFFDFAKNIVRQKYVLGSQRALQFGGPSILKKNTRIYNCASTYVDRPRVFQEIMFTLLCGVGVGFSVQTHHIYKLPFITKLSESSESSVIYKVEDSIEGWSDAIGVLVNSYFVNPTLINNFKIVYDFSLIRPAGSSISHIGGKAPGPDGLEQSLKKIKLVFENCLEKGLFKLRPIDAYDIIMHLSDAVLSGGIRRSACISIFSLHDKEMIEAKTGDWYIKNPQRGRSNNSVLLIRDSTPEDKFMELIKSVKQFGEPGFIWSNNTESLFNPCCEINMYAYDEDGNSGIQMCNLSEINMSNVSSDEDFFDRCKAGAILGTLQAGYTDFGYLGEVTRNIVEKEALIGVSMTGMMDNPKYAFNKDTLTRGATIVKQINEELACIIGINKAARTTTIKPAGSTSCLLNSSSGIHPSHARRYFRRVQSNTMEEPLKFFRKFNPQAIEKSVWSSGNTDDVITFLCKSKPDSLIKSDISAHDLLEKVKLVQKYWVNTGKNIENCTKPWLNHNVSNTITIKNDDEWESSSKFIYNNREFFAGISMLGNTGDLDYQQAPFQEIYDHNMITEMYGAGSVFASGLIIHALDCFNDLYSACSALLGYEKLVMPDLTNNNTCLIDSDKIYKKIRWIAQANKFSIRHFNNDKLKMSYCLKHVDAWKKWCDLKRSYKNVPWIEFLEDSDNTKPSENIACSGNSCELINF